MTHIEALYLEKHKLEEELIRWEGQKRRGRGPLNRYELDDRIFDLKWRICNVKSEIASETETIEKLFEKLHLTDPART